MIDFLAVNLRQKPINYCSYSRFRYHFGKNLNFPPPCNHDAQGMENRNLCSFPYHIRSAENSKIVTLIPSGIRFFSFHKNVHLIPLADSCR
jgi:hypothetical protein